MPARASIESPCRVPVDVGRLGAEADAAGLTYGLPQLPPGVCPPGYAAHAALNPRRRLRRAALPLRQASVRAQFTQQQPTATGPADWFPASIRRYRRSSARQAEQARVPRCATADGRGALKRRYGLPADYIRQQLRDFSRAPPQRRSAQGEHGKRRTARRRFTDKEIDRLPYFSSSVPNTAWSADPIPATRIQAISPRPMTAEPADRRSRDGGCGERGRDAAPTRTQASSRTSPRATSAEAPTTSGVARRWRAACHGPDSKASGRSGLAGRSPSYLARQIYDIQLGTRRAIATMLPVVANLTDETSST
jgi:cytochrome c553